MTTTAAQDRQSFKQRFAHRIGNWLGISPLTLTPQFSRVRIPPNAHDAKGLSANLEVYYEFPPIFNPGTTRWGDPWTLERYPTPEALLGTELKDRYPVFWAEATSYTWICYARLGGD